MAYIPGHGAEFAFEKDGDPGGTFTVIAQITSEISHGLTRAQTEVTPHEETIDRYVVSPVMSRDDWTWTITYDDALASHGIATGLLKRYVDNDTFGIRMRGPGGGTDDDELIASGQLTGFVQSNPAREGDRTAEITFRPSGPMKIDGTIYS